MNNPQTATPKKNNTLMLIIGAVAGIILCFCCIVIAISLAPSDSSSPSDPPSIFSTDIKIKYVISGSATSALVTYFNEQGGMEQVNVNVPWTKEMTVSPGAALSLVAQNSGSGSITCEIWMDDNQEKTSTSSAQYAVVTCTDFAH